MAKKTGSTGTRRGVVEVLLDSVDLRDAGGAGAGTNHALCASLVWPRSTVAGKATVKIVPLADGRGDWRGASWTERILFKETVEGTFGLRVGLTRSLSAAKFAELSRYVAGGLFKLFGAEAGSLLAGALAAGLVKLPLEFLNKELRAAQELAALAVAEGTVDLRCDTWQAGHDETVRLMLQSTGGASRAARPRAGAPAPARRRRAGAEDRGVVELTVRRL